MVTVRLVRCTEEYWDFKAGEVYLHKMSKNGNFLVKESGKDEAEEEISSELGNGEWKAILSPPRLIIDWASRNFKRHFQVLPYCVHVKNHKEADKVKISDFRL